MPYSLNPKKNLDNKFILYMDSLYVNYFLKGLFRIKLTANGKKLFAKAEPLYAEQVKQIMAGFNQAEQKKLISALENIRHGLTD